MTSRTGKMPDAELVRHTWGDAPDWINALALECDARGRAKTAKRLGYSQASLSYVLAHKYPGALGRVERRVRDILMRSSVTCGVLGEITTDACFANQTADFNGSNPLRVRLYRACRADCPHSRLDSKGDSDGK